MLVALGVIRKNRRHSTQLTLTDTQKAFDEHGLYDVKVRPASYTRFLWFCGCLMVALLALVSRPVDCDLSNEAVIRFLESSIPTFTCQPFLIPASGHSCKLMLMFPI